MVRCGAFEVEDALSIKLSVAYSVNNSKKPSAFDNVWQELNWKKPLRDKELTDSIEVIS